MKYYLSIRHKGECISFARQSMEDAYEVAKLISRLLGIRIIKPKKKVWLRWTTDSCYFEYDITHKADREFWTKIAIRSQQLPNEFWHSTRPHIERKLKSIRDE